jgi:hypothetical protein
MLICPNGHPNHGHQRWWFFAGNGAAVAHLRQTTKIVEKSRVEG